ncbi:MAG: hypothetical protein KDD64_09845 [Bdellovibrionales bacterium]|nr:hypothetical protein [Bdellovibrionales bacterium]
MKNSFSSKKILLEGKSLVAALSTMSLFFLAGCGSAPSDSYVVLIPNIPSEIVGGRPAKVISPGEEFIDIPYFDSRFEVSYGAHSLADGDGKSLDQVIQTREGELLTVRSTLTYSFQKDGAFQFVVVYGNNEGALRNHLRLLVLESLQRSFGEVTAVEVLDSAVQRRSLESVRDSLRESFASLGLSAPDFDIVSVESGDRLSKEIAQSDADLSQKALQKTDLLRELSRLEKEKELVAIELKREDTSANAEALRIRQLGDLYLEGKVKEVAYLQQELAVRKEALEAKLESLSGAEGEVLVKLEILQHLVQANPELTFSGDARASLAAENPKGTPLSRGNSRSGTKNEPKLGVIELENRPPSQ